MRILVVGDTIDKLTGMFTFGGLERQVMGTARALEGRGHSVEVINLFWQGLKEFSALRDADVVHIFNTGGPRGGLITIGHLAKHFGVPVVFSTVYWSPWAMLRDAEAQGVGVDKRLIESNWAAIADVVQAADLLMPNSELEARQLFEDLSRLGRGVKPYVVIPNAVDEDELLRPHDGLSGEELDKLCSWEESFREKSGYILCAGRVEWRKNQLGLLRAVRLLKERAPRRDLRVLFIGGIAGDGDLLRAIERESVGLEVAYLGPLPPRVVHAAMRHAAVYAQPSYYETPGLASLEAAALGVPLVVGSWGSEPEYFGYEAFYCEPNDPESIAIALDGALGAYGSERVQKLREAVLAKYNYRRVGELVEAGYNMLVR